MISDNRHILFFLPTGTFYVCVGDVQKHVFQRGFLGFDGHAHGRPHLQLYGGGAVPVVSGLSKVVVSKGSLPGLNPGSIH